MRQQQQQQQHKEWQQQQLAQYSKYSRLRLSTTSLIVNFFVANKREKSPAKRVLCCHQKLLGQYKPKYNTSSFTLACLSQFTVKARHSHSGCHSNKIRYPPDRQQSYAQPNQHLIFKFAEFLLIQKMINIYVYMCIMRLLSCAYLFILKDAKHFVLIMCLFLQFYLEGYEINTYRMVTNTK